MTEWTNEYVSKIDRLGSVVVERPPRVREVASPNQVMSKTLKIVVMAALLGA